MYYLIQLLFVGLITLNAMKAESTPEKFVEAFGMVPLRTTLLNVSDRTNEELISTDIPATSYGNNSVSWSQSPNTSVQSRGQVHLLCRPMETTSSIQSHRVILFRISSFAIQAANPGNNYHFNVDSTIYKLIIDVPVYDSVPPKLIQPSGAVVTTREKRSSQFTKQNIGQYTRQTMYRHIEPDFPESSVQLSELKLKRKTDLSQASDKNNVTNVNKTFLTGYKSVSRFRKKLLHNEKDSRHFNWSGDKSKRLSESKMSTEIMLQELPSQRNAREAMFELNPVMRQWEINMPDPGTWTINTVGQPPTNITVEAFSDLDFKFDFLDYSMRKLELPPIAHDPCVVSIHIASPAICLYNLTSVDLYSEAGDVLVSSNLSDQNLDKMQQDLTRSGSLSVQAVFQATPSIPFFLCLRGFDVKGFPFQRWSNLKIVPRMFAISIQQNMTLISPFSPSRNTTFLFWLRNADQDAIFKISASFDNEFVTAKARPSIIKVDHRPPVPISLTVIVSPSLLYPGTVLMNITATRALDGLSEQLLGSIEVVPAIFTMDNSPPICRLTSTSGSCRLDQACHLQWWGVEISVLDLMTGVSTADFVNTPNGAITDVWLTFLGNNGTAMAKYSYICCNTIVVLEVKDNANNLGRCTFVAPKVEPTTAAKDETSTVLENSIALITAAPPATDKPLIVVMTIETTGNTASHGLIPGRLLKRKTESWNDEKYKSLKTDAIIIGSVAGTSGMAIVLICVVYKCSQGKSSNRSGRSTSDITMRNSWEESFEEIPGNATMLQRMDTSDDSVYIEMGLQGSNDVPPIDYTLYEGAEPSQTPINVPTRKILAEPPTIKILRSQCKNEDGVDVSHSSLDVKDNSQGFGDFTNQTSMIENNTGETYKAMVEIQKRLAKMNVRMMRLAEVSDYDETPESSFNTALVQCNRLCNETPPGTPTTGATRRNVTPEFDSSSFRSNEVDIDTESISASNRSHRPSIGPNSISLQDGVKNTFPNRQIVYHSVRPQQGNGNATDLSRLTNGLSQSNDLKSAVRFNVRDSKTHVKGHDLCLRNAETNSNTIKNNRATQSLTLPALRISRPEQHYFTPELHRHILQQNLTNDTRRCSAPETLVKGVRVHQTKPVSIQQVNNSGPANTRSGRQLHSQIKQTDDMKGVGPYEILVGSAGNPEGPVAEVRNYVYGLGEGREMEITHDLRHVRDKLYRFQRLIDRKIEEKGRIRLDSDSSISSVEDERK